MKQGSSQGLILIDGIIDTVQDAINAEQLQNDCLPTVLRDLKEARAKLGEENGLSKMDWWLRIAELVSGIILKLVER